MKKSLLFSCIVSPLAITPLFMPLATLSSCGQAIPKDFGGLIVNAQKNSKVFFYLTGIDDASLAPDLQYSRDNGRSWKKAKFSTNFNNPTYYNIKAGGHILLKGNNPKGFSGVSPVVGKVRKASILFSKESSVTIDGNVMGLVDNGKGKTKTIPNTNCFLTLFSTSTTSIDYANPITKVSENLLPATTLSNGCYANMFSGCEKLTNTPLLPAKIIKENSYLEMFYNCKSLTKVDTIRGTQLDTSCYQSMFENCTSLTSAPQLSASILAQNCYRSMFQGCKSLVESPHMTVEPNVQSCYKQMFADCTSLSRVNFSFSDWRSCYKENTEGWFKNCPNDQQCLLSWPNVPSSIINTWITGLGGRNSGTIPDKWLIDSSDEFDSVDIDLDSSTVVGGKNYLTTSSDVDISTSTEYTINVDVSDLSLSSPESTFGLYFTKNLETVTPTACDIHIVDIYADGKRFAGGDDVEAMKDNEFYVHSNESTLDNEIVINRAALTATSTITFKFFTNFSTNDVYPCFYVYE